MGGAKKYVGRAMKLPENVHHLGLSIVSGNKGSSRDLFPETPAETCVGMYRARYSYYLRLVATAVKLVNL